jgi:hypothetical protein
VSIAGLIPALSVRQPWAELILRVKKTIEVRTWDPPYRGKIYLHTGRLPDGYRILDFGMQDVFRGGYVGIMELAAIVPFNEDRWEQWRPQHLSNGPFRPDLFAWMIRNPRRFVNPIPAPGKPDLYYPDPSIVAILEATPLIVSGKTKESKE